jgi:hypothetical protein
MPRNKEELRIFDLHIEVKWHLPKEEDDQETQICRGAVGKGSKG